MTGEQFCAAIFCGILFALGAVIKSNLDVRAELRHQQAQMVEYVRALNLVNETQTEIVQGLAKAAEGTVPFEATGYTAQPRDDGRVEITFLRKIGPVDPENPEKEGDMAEFRTVILPAWMWAQVTAEAALKLGFQALEKAKTEEAAK